MDAGKPGVPMTMPAFTGGHDHIVSLGRSCQSAWQLRRITGQTQAQALDWVVTTEAAVRAVLQHGLDGWFDRDRLVEGEAGAIEDRVTGVRFLHEFEKNVTLDQALATHAARNAELAQRWAALMRASGSALFVRQMFGWRPRDNAVAIRDALGCAAPGLRQHLLVLLDGAAFDPAWQDEGITYAPLRQTTPYDWHGDNESWEAALSLCGVAAVVA